MNLADGLLVMNTASTWAMLGLSLYGHRVTYASLDRYGRADYPATEVFLQTRTAPIVVVFMVAEFGSAVALIAALPAGVSGWQAWLGTLLVGVCVASTAFLQVPLHNRLATGFDVAAHARLLRTNRIRVITWIARGVLVAAMLGERLGDAA